MNAPGTHRGYWSLRWHGQAPWRLLFWRDMLGVGSAINLFTGFVGLFLLSQGQPVAWALAVHFAPAISLPPEVPGVAAADVFARQVWWFATVAATGVDVSSSGGNAAHENRQPFLALNYIICVVGLYPSRP